MREALTKQRVASLRSTSRISISDTVCSGLMLRVSPTGVKAWSVVGRLGGRWIRVAIGPYPRWSLAEAREQARRIKQDLDVGQRPLAAAPDPGALTVLSLGARFLRRNRRRLARSTRREWCRLLRREIVPLWGAQVAASAGVSEVRKWSEALATRSPYIANRALEVLRRIYSWGIAEGLVARSPCAGLAPPHRERPRERVLSLEEARGVWTATYPRPVCDRAKHGRTKTSDMPGVRLLLLTAARLGEVLGMRWDELQLGGAALWTVAGERRKGGEPLVLPLVPEAVAILRAFPRSSPWVFPSPTGRGPVSSVSWGYAIRARSGVTCRLHDLRKTLASQMSGHGIAPHVVEAILGHRQRGIVAVYQRYAPLAAMREALEWWAGQITG